MWYSRWSHNYFACCISLFLNSHVLHVCLCRVELTCQQLPTRAPESCYILLCVSAYSAHCRSSVLHTKKYCITMYLRHYQTLLFGIKVGWICLKLYSWPAAAGGAVCPHGRKSFALYLLCMLWILQNVVLKHIMATVERQVSVVCVCKSASD